jgi:protein disulfide-isomerase A1
MLMPEVTKLTKEIIDEFKTKGTVVIGYFDDIDGMEYENFVKVAKELRNDFIFGFSIDPSFKEKGVDIPGIVLYKKSGRSVFPENVDEELVVQDKGSFSVDRITRFVMLNSIPMLSEITPENDYDYTKLPLGMLFFGDEEQKKLLAAELMPIAKKYLGMINFALIDGNTYGDDVDRVALSQDWPQFAIRHPNGYKFALRGTVSGNVNGFVE